MHLQAFISGLDRDPTAIRLIPMGEFISFKSTNVVTPGSAKLEAMFAHRSNDEWLYRFRANDLLTLQASVSGPGAGQTGSLRTIWKGLLDNPQHDLSLGGGNVFPVQASTLYKLLEVTTEGDYIGGQIQSSLKLVTTGGLTAAQIVEMAADAVGIGPSGRMIDTSSPDIRSVPTPLIGFDPTSYPGVNHQFQTWGNIVSGAAQFVGRELFTDENGILVYRKSHYEDPPVGQIRPEWVIHPTVSIDSDTGLANQIRVKHGLYETDQQEGFANAPPNYPMQHYRNRQLTIAAPWILDIGSSEWYANWILSWTLHNTRPGIVQLAFSPDIVCGECYVFPLPHPAIYYVMSVVHNYQAGQPPTTTLGLSYGRELNAQKWFDLPAPTDFGGQNGSAALATTGTGLGDVSGYPRGARWRTTHYTEDGLKAYENGSDGQPTLVSDFTTDQSAFLIGFFGYELFHDYYLRTPADTVQHTYGSVRECAIDPTYVIPELSDLSLQGATGQTSQVHLSKGDMLLLVSNGMIVEVGDRIGTDATYLNADQTVGTPGRQLDIFFPDGQTPNLQDYDDVVYLYVQEAGMLPPPFYNTTSRTVVTTPGQPVPTWTDGGAVAGTAEATMAQLQPDEIEHNRVAPGGSGVGIFCKTGGYFYPPPAPPNSQDPSVIQNPQNRGDCQCVLFVRYCYQFNGVSLRPVGSAYQADDPGNWIADGMVNITGQPPQAGDIMVFDRAPASATAEAAPDGHVAIVTGVTMPTASGPGSVTVAQSNCLVGADGLPMNSSWPLINSGSGQGVKIVDSYPNYFGPTFKSLLRYGAGMK